MAESALLVLFTAGLAYAIAIGAWVASGVTPIRPGVGLSLALVGGLIATLAIDWFVGSRERDSLISGGLEWLTLAGAIGCVLVGGLLQGLAIRDRVG